MKRLLAVCTVMLLAAAASAATVGGKVTFVTKRGQNPVPNETLVWLQPLSGKLRPRPAAAFQVFTRSKMLVPHVMAVPVGSTIAFPNDDPISHNLFSLSPASTFDLGLYRKGPGKTQKFDKPGVINLYCNVHPNMSAVLHVMETPYYAFADATGAYSLADVPPGKYRLTVWNEQGGQTDTPIEIAANGTVTGNASVTLDSRSYRAAQHLNKEGKAYTAPRSKDY
jgi:plastocyanin